jgi:uncharacterized membrane protein
MIEILQTAPLWVTLPVLAGAAFVQNMAFTAVSRSRNSADVAYHRRCSWASNGVWFVIQVGLFGVLFQALTTGSFLKIAAVGVVYVLATTEGSCFMMARLLRRESDKQRPGATARP